MAGIRWTQQEDQKLKELAATGKYGFNHMAPFFPKRNANSLQIRARFLGLDSTYRFHLYEFDEMFFDKPNYINCFWAGWLSADGCLHKYSEMLYALCWRMHHKDEYYMRLFIKHIKYTGPITYQDSYGYGGKRDTPEKQSVLKISRVDIGKYHLTKFGITPNKTKRLPGPYINEIEFKLAYLAGYINGDGCVNFCTSWHKNDCRIVELLSIKIFSSSFTILDWILELVAALGLPSKNKKKRNINKKPESDNCGIVSFSGLEAIYLFELLSLCPIPIMERKWKQQKILDYIARQKEKYPEKFMESIEQVMIRNNIDFSRFPHNYPLKLEEYDPIQPKNPPIPPDKTIISAENSVSLTG